MKTKLLTIRSLAASSALLAATVSANTISIGFDPIVTPVAGGQYDWSYTATFVNSYLQANESRIVIFDFAGYVPGFELTPAGWSFSTVATGPAALAAAAAFSVPSHSDTAIVNLLWDFVGASGLVPNGTSLEFGARSHYSDAIQNSYGSRDRGTSGTASSNSAAQGPTLVPTSPVPDGGSTVAMAGVGFLILGFLARARPKYRRLISV